jgi:hypothetical protein
MADVKIIFLEDNEFVPSESFCKDGEEIADWVKKVLDEEPGVKIYSFKEKENSNLLKIVKKEIPDVNIEFIDENSLDVIDSSKPTNNVICAVLSRENEILGFQLQIGTPVPVNFFSMYAKAKQLAQYINDK